jgi:retron-type reverse transcriptase
VLANLCTYKGYLPQGAVTSPSISNIIFSTIDDQIQSLCSKKRVSYTRYADDLSFSSNNKQVLIETVDIVKSEIISKSIFKINETKSRLMSGQKANIVTGLRLNSNKLSIGNKKKKITKGKIT